MTQSELEVRQAEFQKLLELAESEDESALFLLGEAYSEGYMVKKDLAKAFEYQHKAAALGYPPAVLATGLNLLSGSGVEKNTTKGYEYLKILAYIYEDTAPDDNRNMDYEVAKANYVIGLGHMRGDFGFFGKQKKAMPYLERASKLGYAEAQVLLSELYYIGKGTPHDVDKSIFLGSMRLSSCQRLAKGKRKRKKAA